VINWSGPLTSAMTCNTVFLLAAALAAGFNAPCAR